MAAALWGFAEATVFFLVPDVLLTWVALHDGRAALRACFAALAGALLGGGLMYGWGAGDAVTAKALLERIPAISSGMLERVDAEIATSGALALFVGPLRGTPYKTYAVLAGARGGRLARFLAVSVPARLLRFVALTLLAAWVAERPLRRWPLRRKRTLHATLWGAFYLAYFALMPN